MSLITSLPEIDNVHDSVFVIHERFEKFIPFHSHLKGQLSYVEGGLPIYKLMRKNMLFQHIIIFGSLKVLIIF